MLPSCYHRFERKPQREKKLETLRKQPQLKTRGAESNRQVKQDPASSNYWSCWLYVQAENGGDDNNAVRNGAFPPRKVTKHAALQSSVLWLLLVYKLATVWRSNTFLIVESCAKSSKKGLVFDSVEHLRCVRWPFLIKTWGDLKILYPNRLYKCI